MTTHSYQSTGVLVLDRITPVIEAIFCDMNIGPFDPTSREAFIETEFEHQSWTDIFCQLASLAIHLGTSLPASASRIEVLDAIATRLNLSLNEHRKRLIEILSEAEAEDGNDYASPADLFTIASVLDDGHGLTAIMMEGAWHSDKLRQFYFGGNGMYVTKEVHVQSTSSEALSLGVPLHTALVENDVDIAALHLSRFTENLLLGISKEDLRHQVRVKLAQRFQLISKQCK